MEADETPETTTEAAAPAEALITETTTPALEAKEAPPVTLETLAARCAVLEEANQRILTVLLGIATMPEHSSLSRPFAARCENILLGRH